MMPEGLGELGQAADVAAAANSLTRYRAGLSPATLRAHDNDLATWARYLEARGLEGAQCAWSANAACWAGVSWGLLEAYLTWLTGEGYAPATQARAIATLRAYIREAARAGVVPPDALRMIETVKPPAPRADRPAPRRGAKKSDPTPLSRAQGRALKTQPRDTPIGRRDALLMALLLDLGLRVGEVAALTVTNLNLAEGLLTFWRPKVQRAQTLSLHVTPDLAAAAQAYAQDMAPSGPLLRPGRNDGSLGEGGMGVRAIRLRVGELGERAGVAYLGPHDCRHAWATWALRGGTSLRDLQEAGGWSSPVMPLRYAAATGIANARVTLGGDDDEIV